ncbi:MAG: hypothetical protein JSR60_11770 [Proteobacteria bacterium]|nr:hypothetical protein [Pseudomonadota bacterium]
MMSGIVTVATVLWIVLGLVFIANGFFVYQVRMARYRVMQTLAEKGQPVPPELLGGSVRRAHAGMMRGGIILIGLGAAFGVFLWAMTEQSMFHGPVGANWLPTLALFPLLLGLSLVLLAIFDRSRPN